VVLRGCTASNLPAKVQPKAGFQLPAECKDLGWETDEKPLYVKQTRISLDDQDPFQRHRLPALLPMGK
jgi:hypothetical protein